MKFKKCRKLPQAVLKKYEFWKDLVFRHGPEKLKEFSGFHDEKLSGDRHGQRSSRLNIQYRVQRELARRCGINVTNLSMLENNKIDIGKRRAEQLAKAFKVHPAIIMFPEYETALIAHAA